MNETLSAILLARLTAALPWLDRAVGLARPYEFAVPNGADERRVKVPVPVSFTASDCERDPYYLIPSAGTGSILFFEDGGTTNQGAGRPAYERTHESTLQLRLWLNPFIGTPPATELELVVALHEALGIGTRATTPELKDLLLSWTIQPAGAALLSAYTFEGETPLLYPPYRLFGAEIKASYRFNPACYGVMPAPVEPVITGLTFTGDDPQEPTITELTFTAP